MSENEQWYDREIAPKLLELGESCRARGMSFLSVVEYEPGNRSRTFTVTDNADLEMVMIQHCAQTAPNLDSYVIGLIRYCREKGIDTRASIVMQQLGKSGDQRG